MAGQAPPAATVPDAPGLAETLRLALASGRPVTARLLLEAFGERSFGLLLSLINLPNVVFAPPALAGIAAVPTAALGFQMLLGRDRPWLPAALLDRPVAADPLTRLLRRAGPWLDRLDALGRPRLAGAAGPLAIRVFGGFALAAALIVLVPVPGTNVLPALALVVMNVALARRDGLLFVAGVAIGLAGIAVAAAAAGLAVELVRWAVAAGSP
jgi:hypothetical protein